MSFWIWALVLWNVFQFGWLYWIYKYGSKIFIKLGRFNLSFSCWIASKTRTQGIYDWVEGGHHVLFLDYDNMREEWVEEELTRLQNEFKLSNLYVIQSSERSFHAICCDVMLPVEAQQIVMQSNADESFKKAMFYDYCSRVLRTFGKGHTAKPQYLFTLKSKHKERQKSLAHLKYLQFSYGIPEKDMNYDNHNNNGKIWMIDYPTKKNIK
jgi:hypothetical protein